MNTFIGNTALSSYLTKLTTATLEHHAFLFAGPDHVGKTHVAKAWIDRLGGAECISLDSTQEDGSRGSISIDQVRDCIDQLSRTTLTGAHRIILINRGDDLSEGASNALLKSLEEPPPNTLFIMLVSDVRSILPTLFSRCFTVRFPLVSDALLKKTSIISENILRSARNRPGIAARLAADPEAASFEDARWEELSYRAMHSFAEGSARGDTLDRDDTQRVEALISYELHKSEPSIPRERAIALYDALSLAHRYERSHMSASRMVESLFV